MKKTFSIIAFLSLTILFTACGSNGKTEKKNEHAGESGEAGHDHDHENTNTATLTEEQIRSIGIEMGKIEQKQLTATVKANGVLRVPNENKALINSLYRGVIKSLLIQPGNTVRKGQVIATVANPEFIQAQEEYLGLSPRIELAEQELNRQKELNQGNAGALKNLQLAESNLRSLNTRKAALEQQIQLMGINPRALSNGNLVSVVSLRSPIGGVVSNVTVQMGTYVDVTTPVAEVVDNSQLHLDLFVYEKDLPRLKNNQNIHFTLTNNPGKEYDAQIFSLGSSFENESKAVSVHARVKGDKTGLIDGMNITALISLDKVERPAVPTDAIVTDKGQDYIFMVTDKHSEEPHDHKEGEVHKHEEKSITFEKVPVVKGTTEVGYTQITLLKTIPSDAKVVVKGAFFVLARINNSGEDAHGH